MNLSCSHQMGTFNLASILSKRGRSKRWYERDMVVFINTSEIYNMTNILFLNNWSNNLINSHFDKINYKTYKKYIKHAKSYSFQVSENRNHRDFSNSIPYYAQKEVIQQQSCPEIWEFLRMLFNQFYFFVSCFIEMNCLLP